MTTHTLETLPTRRQTDIPQNRIALIAGFGLLLMALLALFANFFVLGTLVVPEDGARTVGNLEAHEMRFRLGVAAFFVVLVCDVLVAWALYIFFKPASPSLSLLAALFRLVYAAVFGAALFHLASVLDLSSSASLSTPEQLSPRVMGALEAFDTGWMLALVFFGVHLLLVGVLVLKSGDVPKVLGALLLVAGLGYLANSFAQVLLPNYADYETLFLLLVAVPGIFGEVGFCFWLLLRGTRVGARALHVSRV